MSRVYRDRLVESCREQLREFGAEAGLILDLRDRRGLRLALSAADEGQIRQAFREASRRGCLAVLCVGIPRSLARELAGRQGHALDRMGPAVVPVVIVSGGCWLTGVSNDRRSPSLN